MIDFRGLIQGLQRENFNLYQFLSGMLDRFDKFVLDFSALSSETFVNSGFFKDTSTIAWDFSIPNQVSANVPDKSITYFKIQDVAAGNVLGRRSTNGEVQEVLVANSMVLAAGPALVREALTGDVTAARDSNSTTIANDAVTYAKMQNVSAASKLLGRGDSGAGDPEEIVVGNGLSFSGTTLNAASGQLVYSAVPTDAAINSVTDITIATVDLTNAAANDRYEISGAFIILNNSGATRVYVITIDFDNAFDIEFSTAAMAASATLEHVFFFQGFLSIRSTSLAYAATRIDGFTAAGQASGADSTMGTSNLNSFGWGTTGSNLTGTLTCDLKIRSANATATQTCRLVSFNVRKVA